MRTILAIISLVATVCSASEVTLKWDAPTNATATTTYTLYGSTNAIYQTNYRSSLIIMDCGTNLTAKVEGMSVGKWWFAATAKSAFIESDLSNVVMTETPAAPANMRQLTLQYSMALTNGSWRDIGMLRLRIESPAP